MVLEIIKQFLYMYDMYICMTILSFLFTDMVINRKYSTAQVRSLFVQLEAFKLGHYFSII